MAFLYDAITLSRHKDMRWDLARRFMFTHGLMEVEVCAFELRRLSYALPIAFLKSRKSYHAVALVGDEMLACPAVGEDGSWRREALPIVLWMHPFRVIRHFDGNASLNVARDSECVRRGARRAFFTDGDLSAPVRALARLARRFTRSRERLRLATDTLAQLDLFCPLSDRLASPRHAGYHARFAVLDPERFESLSEEQLASVPRNSLPVAVLLATAALASQRHLRPDLRPPQPGNTKLSLNLSWPRGPLIQSEDPPLNITGESMFMIDDSMLEFHANAQNSVFRSG